MHLFVGHGWDKTKWGDGDRHNCEWQISAAGFIETDQTGMEVWKRDCKGKIIHCNYSSIYQE